MAVRNPNGAPKQYLFKPGQSGNPGGRPKNALNRSKVKKILDKYLLLNKKELDDLINSEATSVLELMIGKTIQLCIKRGDYSRLEALLSRAIGKIQENVDEHDLDDPAEEVSRLSMNELLALVKPINSKETSS